MGGRDRRISEFNASLVYRVSFRTARITQRNSVPEKEKREGGREGRRKQRKKKSATYRGDLSPPLLSQSH